MDPAPDGPAPDGPAPDGPAPDGPASGRPAALLALDVADDPASWARAGFTVTDSCVHLGGLALRLVGPDRRRGVVAWSVVGRDGGPAVGAAVDGIAVVPPPGADDAELPPTAREHANTAVAVDHVVLATPDLAATTESLGAVGWVTRRTVPDPRGTGRTMRFFLVPTGSAGRVVLEVIADPDGGPRRPTVWGLAITALDLDAARRRLGEEAIGKARDAVQPGRRIATVRHGELGMGLPLALITPRG